MNEANLLFSIKIYFLSSVVEFFSIFIPNCQPTDRPTDRPIDRFIDRFDLSEFVFIFFSARNPDSERQGELLGFLCVTIRVNSLIPC